MQKEIRAAIMTGGSPPAGKWQSGTQSQAAERTSARQNTGKHLRSDTITFTGAGAACVEQHRQQPRPAHPLLKRSAELSECSAACSAHDGALGTRILYIPGPKISAAARPCCEWCTCSSLNPAAMLNPSTRSAAAASRRAVTDLGSKATACASPLYPACASPLYPACASHLYPACASPLYSPCTSPLYPAEPACCCSAWLAKGAEFKTGRPPARVFKPSSSPPVAANSRSAAAPGFSHALPCACSEL
mmetsp:Transcript_39387/g.97513  ORF Transcript_39387/g.97513 Transcript_39387/m.97513 type:complete len:247 (+) Transcript_39387:87-827(+)